MFTVFTFAVFTAAFFMFAALPASLFYVASASGITLYASVSYAAPGFPSALWQTGCDNICFSS